MVAGGAGSNTGGTVQLRPGDGPTDGEVLLLDGTGTTRMTVAGSSVTVSGDATFEEDLITQKRISWQGVHTVAAAATISFNAEDYAVIVITDEGSNQANAITVGGTPVDGQLLTVINNDAHDTSGDIVVPANEARLAVYYSGTWYV